MTKLLTNKESSKVLARIMSEMEKDHAEGWKTARSDKDQMNRYAEQAKGKTVFRGRARFSY